MWHSCAVDWSHRPGGLTSGQVYHWGRKGLDSVNVKVNASRGCLVGHVKLRGTNINDNVVNVDFAPSVAQADAVLAQFGFVDREVAVAA